MEKVSARAAKEIVAQAEALERNDRSATVMAWYNAGHVYFVRDMDPDWITVKIEDELLKVARDKFPTAELVAKLSLAIAAGQSERNSEHNVVLRDVDYKELTAAVTKHFVTQGMGDWLK